MTKVCLLGCLLILCATTFSAPGQTSTSNDTAPQAIAAPASAPSPEIARLHVYRQRRYVGSALAPSIVVDGKQVARVGNGRRVTIKLTAGSHTIGSDDKSSAISLDTKVGQDYYVRVDEEAGAWKGHGKLTLLMPEQGRAEFKLQKPVEPDRRLAKEMIEDDKDETASDKMQ